MMLLVVGLWGGSSFRNLDRREVASTKSDLYKIHRDQISFQNHQDGLNTTHTTT